MLYIRIFMIIFIACLLLTAWYLWHRRNGAFLVFDVSSSPELHSLMTICSWTLLAISVLGIVLLFFDTLFLGSATIFIFALLLSQNNQ